MSRTLVVYYSRTGTTRQAAHAIAEALGADLEELVERRSRAGRKGYLRSTIDGVFGRLTELEPPWRSPADYDLVVFGSPVWAGSLSAPVRTYLTRYYDDLEDVAFFCTCGGSGGERVLRQMADLCRKEPMATLILRQIEVERGSFQRKVDHFARTIENALDKDKRAAAPEPTDDSISTLGGLEEWENEGGFVGPTNVPPPRSPEHEVRTDGRPR